MEKQNIRFLSKVDTKSNWETNNPTLEDKELGYERESGRYKIGDGKTTWKELPYAYAETVEATAYYIISPNGTRYTLTVDDEGTLITLLK